jgi:hypothetical protein
MITPADEVRVLNSFDNEILEVIDNQDEFTRSDLQGVVSALVMKIFRAGKDYQKELDSFKKGGE